MKVDRLETHDRYLHFTSQDFDISNCCEHIIKQRPFGEHAFYLWVHMRTAEDGFTKELIWQPRLTRPKPQTNSMLFKAYPTSGEVRVCWMIPPRELFTQYKKGNVTEHDVTRWSIDMFENHREELAQNEPDDLNDDAINAIYTTISLDANLKKVTTDFKGI